MIRRVIRPGRVYGRNKYLTALIPAKTQFIGFPTGVLIIQDYLNFGRNSQNNIPACRSERSEKSKSIRFSKNTETTINNFKEFVKIFVNPFKKKEVICPIPGIR